MKPDLPERLMAAAEWHTSPATGLEAAIAEFKRRLPGWWFSVCECQVSCDASCAPTRESPDIERAANDEQFNGGFHADLAQPSTLAAALEDVMWQALEALGRGKVPASEWVKVPSVG